MKAKRIIISALKRAKKERGLRQITPNDILSSGHSRKADHNLIVMTDLQGLGHEDWVVITAYYAMYHASLSLLTKIGLQSKEHAATVAVLEYFFGKELGKELLERFDELKDRLEAILIEERYIDYLWNVKIARENVQYGVALDYKDTAKVMNNAREFVSKIKLVLEGLNEELIKAISQKIEELKII